jgi:hypothetical protein
MKPSTIARHGHAARRGADAARRDGGAGGAGGTPEADGAGELTATLEPPSTPVRGRHGVAAGTRAGARRPTGTRRAGDRRTPGGRHACVDPRAGTGARGRTRIVVVESPGPGNPADRLDDEFEVVRLFGPVQPDGLP